MNCMHGSGRGISVAAKRSGADAAAPQKIRQATNAPAAARRPAAVDRMRFMGLISSDPSDRLTNPGGRTSGKLPTGNRECRTRADAASRNPGVRRACCGRPEAVERQTLSEDVTHADAPAPRILNVAARRAFKLAVGAPGLRDVRLRANAVGEPAAVKAALHPGGFVAEGCAAFDVAEELVVVGDESVHGAAVVRAVRAESQADSAGERLGVILLDPHAVARRNVVALDEAVGELNLRLDVGVLRDFETVADFGTERERMVVRLDAHVLRRELVLEISVTARQVNEGTGIEEAGGVDRQTPAFSVAVTVGKIDRRVAVAERRTDDPVLDARICTDLNRPSTRMATKP